MKEFIQINPADNVGVALVALSKDKEFITDSGSIILRENVPQGHKFALCDISKGENVIKYGFSIGHSMCDIKAGEYVGKRNLKTNLQGKLDYSDIGLRKQPIFNLAKSESLSFKGFVRKDGQIGIRNEIWVIPTVGCVNGIAAEIARRLKEETKGEGVDGIYAFPHNYGCSQLGDDHENTKRILRDMVLHPNAGGILVVGLGCENNIPSVFEEFCGDYDRERVRFMVCQEIEGDEIEHGLSILRELYEQTVEFKREICDISKLKVGLKCGGSDGLSGITANPLLGVFSDFLTLHGGTTVLTEVPEMFGAETILMERCADRELLSRLIVMINDFKEYFLANGQPISENPSPGNIAGGITTLEEKSLGCVQKSGSSQVSDILNYGDRITMNGLNLLSAPGNDLVASTALAAAGCQMILFTTGRGTPFGTFVPTIKISTNSELARRKASWVDFNAGIIVEDETIDSVSDRLVSYILEVANGRNVSSEILGIHEMAILKKGVTL